MFKSLALAAAILAGGALSAQAADQVTVTESVKLAAPPAKVWEKIGHFADLSWHPAIKASEASFADKPGSQRRLDLGGPILWEVLVIHDAAGRSYTYRILDNGSNQKVLPVSEYTSTILVKPAGAGSEVVWTSSFEPVGNDAAAVQKAIAGVYRAGLDALVKDLGAP
jgi:hypothetical protein